MCRPILPISQEFLEFNYICLSLIVMAVRKDSMLSQRSEQEEHFIGHYDEAPSFMKDNEGITHGYRINFNTPKRILKSMFMLHNESVNIWSHFLPALCLIVISVYLFTFEQASIPRELVIQKQVLTSGLESYSNALNELKTSSKIQQISTEEGNINHLFEGSQKSYSIFSNTANMWVQNIRNNLEGVENYMSGSFHQRTLQLQQLKEDFQKLFVPYLMNQVKGGITNNIDHQYLEELESRLKNFERKIDEDYIKYVSVFDESEQNPQQISKWPIFVFMLSAVFCLMCSCFFHLFYPMSGPACNFFLRLDFSGINILIAGSSLPPLYYGMYCNFDMAAFYLLSISVVALVLFALTLMDFFNKPENENIKSMAFAGFAISLLIPLTHMLINEKLFNNYGDPFTSDTSLGYYVLLSFSYAFGLAIYLARCPERKRPGKHNLCGHSHQLWHFFVVLGLIFTYLGVWESYEMRKISVCPSGGFS